MARPKKSTPEVETETAAEDMPSAVFNKAAYSFFKDTTTGRWTIAKVLFDPSLKLANHDVQVVASEIEKDLALERFRILVATELF